jgi:hypothetical protein
MPRGFAFLLAVTGSVGLALLLSRVPEALAHVERFHVRAVELEGTRYLELDDAVAHIGVAPGLSVWDDLEPVEARLRTHPLVLEARVRRRLPSTLVLEVRERTPVALLPTPVLVPVDPEGHRLPIDPGRHALDLPLLQPRVEGGRSEEGAGELLTPAELRTLAEEVARLHLLEPALLAALSDAALDRWGDVVLRLGEPRVEIRYRPPLSPARLREGLQVLGDALDRSPNRVRGVDLRFEDQVVVRHLPSTRR